MTPSPSTLARHFLGPVLLLASAAALLAASVSERAPAPRGGEGSDWPGFLGPAGDGRSPERGLVFDWPAAGPPLVWRRATGEGYGAPAIADGRLLVFDRHRDRARLTCLDARTGEERWRSEYPTDYEDMYGYSNGPRTTPVVDGERVYAFGVEGRLRCLRVSDGKLLWEVDTAKRFGVVQNFFGVGSTPVVEGELLIAPVGGSPPGSPGILSGKVKGNGSGIVAFDKRTGEVRYAITDELASYASPVLTTIGDRRWGFALMRGGLVAFEPASGKVDFEFPWRSRKLESVNASNPVVVGDRVLISESYGPGTAVLRVRPGGYEVLWKDPPRGKSLETHWMTPVHHDGWVYGSSGQSSGDAELRAIELATGRVAWRKRGLGRATLVYVDGHLIALTERGRLLAVEATPEAYRAVAEVDLAMIKYPAWNAPALARGLLYLRGKDRLACFDLRGKR